MTSVAIDAQILSLDCSESTQLQISTMQSLLPIPSVKIARAISFSFVSGSSASSLRWLGLRPFSESLRLFTSQGPMVSSPYRVYRPVHFADEGEPEIAGALDSSVGQM